MKEIEKERENDESCVGQRNTNTYRFADGQCESYDEGKTVPKKQQFQLPEQLHRVISSVAI